MSDDLTLEGAALIDANERERDERRRHLSAVTDDGEIRPGYPTTLSGALERIRLLEDELATKEVELEALEGTVRSEAAKRRLAQRDREKTARQSQLWPLAVEALAYWKLVCDHPRTEMTSDRFYLLEPYLKKPGIEWVKVAIDGAAHDPYRASKPNRNGKLEVYDSLETIFKTRDSFKRHIERAPRERVLEAKQESPPAAVVDFDARLRALVTLELLGEGDPARPEDVARIVEESRQEIERRRGVGSKG